MNANSDDGPENVVATKKQLVRDLAALQVLVIEGDPSVDDEARELLTRGGDWALISVASIIATRIHRCARIAVGGPIPFPRADLARTVQDAYPEADRTTALEIAARIYENDDDAAARAALDHAIADPIRAWNVLALLLAYSIEVGKQVLHVDPSAVSLQQLVQEESLALEQLLPD